MARPLRVEVPGGVYHVTARGNDRHDIFRDDTDRQGFLDLLGHTVDRWGWRCHAYCLMSNHYHLLIETPQPNLARGMRHLNGVYTQHFNRRHNRIGHVFQERYKAIIAQKDAHLLELCRYVVLNPIRARLVPHVRDWGWSSYRATAGQGKGPLWLTVEWLLGQFARDPHRAHQAYRRFVAEGLGHTPWEEVTGQVYYGDETFVTTLAKQTASPEVPRRQRQPLRPALSQLLSTGTPQEIGRAYREYGYRLGEMAHHLGVHYSTVSRRLQQFEYQRSA
ncbi:MAG: REP-associated tyrosine transposase [Candidatus Binatia bacterium]